MPFVPPNLTVRWGDYFKPDPDDDKKLVEVAAAALDAKIATRRMAVEKIRRVFGIENVRATLEAIEEEAEENAKRFSAAAHAAGPEDEEDATDTGDSGQQPDAGTATGTRSGAGPQPPQAPGTRVAPAPRARPR